MPRHKRPRYISQHPEIKSFQPEGQSGDSQRPDDEINLSVEEYEAIRLVDYMGYDQAEAALNMNVSRQTFGRVLKQARSSLATAIVTGKKLKVGGGCYRIGQKGRGRRRRHGKNSG
ncbi:MAG: DUF134 domain-containing protein [Desulfobacteraceae bacterium]